MRIPGPITARAGRPGRRELPGNLGAGSVAPATVVALVAAGAIAVAT